MPKDWIIFGVLAGFVGNIVKEALAWILYAFGWVRYTFVHIGAGYFVDAEFIDNPVSLLTGFIADWVVAGTIGDYSLFAADHRQRLCHPEGSRHRRRHLPLVLWGFDGSGCHSRQPPHPAPQPAPLFPALALWWHCRLVCREIRPQNPPIVI